MAPTMSMNKKRKQPIFTVSFIHNNPDRFPKAKALHETTKFVDKELQSKGIQGSMYLYSLLLDDMKATEVVDLFTEEKRKLDEKESQKKLQVPPQPSHTPPPPPTTSSHQHSFSALPPHMLSHYGLLPQYAPMWYQHNLSQPLYQPTSDPIRTPKAAEVKPGTQPNIRATEPIVKEVNQKIKEKKNDGQTTKEKKKEKMKKIKTILKQLLSDDSE